MRKRRPALRTPEIHAYNWGARARRAGIEAAGLLPLDGFTPLQSLEVRELEALHRLGAEEFHRWAFRGWLEAQNLGGEE